MSSIAAEAAEAEEAFDEAAEEPTAVEQPAPEYEEEAQRVGPPLIDDGESDDFDVAARAIKAELKHAPCSRPRPLEPVPSASTAAAERALAPPPRLSPTPLQACRLRCA